MKILIANDGMHAHYHERLAWTNAFNSIPGVQAAMYNIKQTRAFDIFDSFEPDIYLGQAYNLDSATIKCLKMRPHTKVGLRVGEWNDEDKHDGVLYATEEEINILDELWINFLYIHYLQEDIEKTHVNFINKGYNIVGIPMAADLHTYCDSVFKEELACDVAFVGGYWPYKGLVIDKYLTPLCYDSGLHIKIFGNQPWPHVNQYCGMLNDSDVKNLFKSAKVCPNLSEPHAQERGIDVNERSFKVFAAGGLVISDEVKALQKMIPSIPMAKNPEVFKYLINYFLENPKQRETVISNCKQEVFKNHSNFHRIKTIFEALDEDIMVKETEKVMHDFIHNIQ